MDDPNTPTRLDRREAIKWMLAASATVPFLSSKSKGQGGPSIPTPGGYGHDPNLLGTEIPWERTLTEEQLKTVTSICDTILPRVSDSPSASELNVPDFIDEWVSAPYPDQQADRTIVLDGLEWINWESEKRFGKPFYEIADDQKTAICDDIAYLPNATSGYKEGARYFAKFRDLTMGGYYTTDYGTKEVGYVGNVALAKFEGPPPEVLKFLGVDKAPW